MRLLITADLHYNHRHSRPLAEDLIRQMNAAGGDVLLVIGDTAVADGEDLEACLNLFHFAGPKLFVAGNHELWTRREDSYAIYHEELPRRVAALGWQWLEEEPFVADGVAILGSVGWYDYSFAAPGLGIPRRFYEQKISPGAAERGEKFGHLLQGDDISPHGRELYARWNDGRYVHLQRSDETFLAELLARLQRQMEQTQNARKTIAAIHHVPFVELLPQAHRALFEFVRAYLGSAAIGETLRRCPTLTHVFCGHSHMPREARIQGMPREIQAINIGSGYRAKTYRAVDIE